MPNAGNLPAPAGQTYHLPPGSLRGYICSKPANYQKIVDHKLSMGIPDDNHLYDECREAVKDQMLARGLPGALGKSIHSLTNISGKWSLV